MCKILKIQWLLQHFKSLTGSYSSNCPSRKCEFVWKSRYISPRVGEIFGVALWTFVGGRDGPSCKSSWKRGRRGGGPWREENGRSFYLRGKIFYRIDTTYGYVVGKAAIADKSGHLYELLKRETVSFFTFSSPASSAPFTKFLLDINTFCSSIVCSTKYRHA